MPSAQTVARLKELLAERAKRKIEALKLYEPLPAQQGFHASLAKERLLRGSNRGGKTLPAAIELARAVTGQDPYSKYPKKNGRAFCIGRDGAHIAQVMWRKLSRAGAFLIIKDQVTGQWRNYRPWTDMHRKHEAKPSPPLIPPRMIEEVAWENKKESQPSLVRLVNGWEISFFSSLGKPPRGSDVDIVWFDEEIIDKEWYPEMSARLIDRGGRFWWAATPQTGTEQLYSLHEMAQQQASWKRPRVSEHFVHIDANPYISEEEKKEFGDKLSEQEYEVRYAGNFVLLSYLVFPEFDPILHCTEFFHIPKIWTRYAFIDPGRQTCAVLFLACADPESEWKGKIIAYDELYIRNCSSDLFGRKMDAATQGQTIQAFVIDWHGSRSSDAHTGLTIEDHYRKALRRYGVRSVLTGSGFFKNTGTPESQVEASRGWLIPKEDGPKFYIFSDKCPNFIREIKRYRYQQQQGIATDKPVSRGDVHLMACFRYAGAYNPVWVPPQTGSGKSSGAVAALRAKQKRMKKDNETYVRLG